MAGKKGQKKRFWSDDEKHTICAQARVASVSVAQEARRYSMNANLIHKWLRDPRFATDFSDDVLEIDEVPAFLPVEIRVRLHPWCQSPHRRWRLPCRRSVLISLYRMVGVYWWKARRACLLLWLWSKD